MIQAYAELIDFIANGATPREVVDFSPSEATKARVADLLERNRMGVLSEEEKAELEDYMQLEHIMRMAKAKARLRVAKG